jgi:glycosyltransferase involved in cell wall biosynthesis
MRDRKVLRARDPDPRRIAIALTSYNRSDLVREAIANVADDERIAEIVISDDCSDPQDFEQLGELAAMLGPRVRLFRNPINYGGFKNKIIALSHCTSTWAVLLDSDNVLPRSYLDKLYTLPEWRIDTIYCPDFARPGFNFAPFAGMAIDADTAVDLLSDETLQSPFRTLLNTGNYFAPAKELTALLTPVRNAPVRAACSIAAVYQWLSSGRRLQVVEGLEYYHRVHDDSYFLRENDASKNIVGLLCDALAEGKGRRVFDTIAPETSKQGSGQRV